MMAEQFLRYRVIVITLVAIDLGLVTLFSLRRFVKMMAGPFPRYPTIVIALVVINLGLITLLSLRTNISLSYESYDRKSLRYKQDDRSGAPLGVVRSRVIDLSEKEFSIMEVVGGIGMTYKWPRSLGLTNPNTSEFKIVDGENLHVGDLVKINIIARDENGRRRTSGGDFFSILLIQEEQNASTAARVIDHNNGTYTAYAYAGWPGKSIVSVTLVHPSDAVFYLKYNYTLLDRRAGFLGIFEKDNVTEQTRCVIQHEGSWEKKCEYFHPNNLYSTRLLCDPPPTLPCDALTVLPRSDDTNALNMPMVPEDKKYLFEEKRRYQKIRKGSSVVTVKEVENPSSPLKLVSCTQADANFPFLDGFWKRGRYNSLVCNNSKWFNIEESTVCLENKHLLLLGDSQLRLWIRKIKTLLGISVKVDKFTHALFMSKPSLNFNVTFQFHPFFRHPDEGYSLVSDHRYETQILDEIDYSHCNYIVVFGPWAHYALWTPAAYQERLEFLRDGILRFMNRCPDAVVILKGPQPTKTTTTFFDYICKSMMDTQREVFGDLNIKYMNTWDMIESAYWYQDPHPPDDVINIQFQQLLSYSCS